MKRFFFRYFRIEINFQMFRDFCENKNRNFLFCFFVLLQWGRKTELSHVIFFQPFLDFVSTFRRILNQQHKFSQTKQKKRKNYERKTRTRKFDEKMLNDIFCISTINILMNTIL